MASWHQSQSNFVAQLYQPERDYKVVSNSPGQPASAWRCSTRDEANRRVAVAGGTLVPPARDLKVTVHNLNTGKEAGMWMGISPTEAVLAAYAQEVHNDYQTDRYFERHGDKIVYGEKSVAVGDFCAVL